MLRNRRQLNDKLASIRRDLHRQGRHVSSDAVLEQACQELGVSRLWDLGLGPPEQLAAVQEVKKLEQLIFFCITSYTDIK